MSNPPVEFRRVSSCSRLVICFWPVPGKRPGQWSAASGDLDNLQKPTSVGSGVPSGSVVFAT